VSETRVGFLAGWSVGFRVPFLQRPHPPTHNKHSPASRHRRLCSNAVTASSGSDRSLFIVRAEEEATSCVLALLRQHQLTLPPLATADALRLPQIDAAASRASLDDSARLASAPLLPVGPVTEAHAFSCRLPRHTDGCREPVTHIARPSDAMSRPRDDSAEMIRLTGDARPLDGCCQQWDAAYYSSPPAHYSSTSSSCQSSSCLGSTASSTCSCASHLSAGSAAAGCCPIPGLLLGPLRGVGSFGRVYRGVYRGKPVAVKVGGWLCGSNCVVKSVLDVFPTDRRTNA
jgi:hypothetical protein